MPSPWTSASSFNWRSSGPTSPQSPARCRAMKKPGSWPLASIASRAPGVAASRPRGNFAAICIVLPSIKEAHTVAVEGHVPPDQFRRPARLAFEEVPESRVVHRNRDDPSLLGVEEEQDDG